MGRATINLQIHCSMDWRYQYHLAPVFIKLGTIHFLKMKIFLFFVSYTLLNQLSVHLEVIGRRRKLTISERSLPSFRKSFVDVRVAIDVFCSLSFYYSSCLIFYYWGVVQHSDISISIRKCVSKINKEELAQGYEPDGQGGRRRQTQSLNIAPRHHLR